MKKNIALLLVGLISVVSCKKDTSNKNNDLKGGKYGVEINANYEITLGTQEKFRLQDHLRFVVDLSGATATISNIENTEASIQKIQDSQFGCASSIQVSGTGPINEEGIPQVQIDQVTHEVYVSLGVGGHYVYPSFLTSCPGVTPAVNEIPLAGMAGATISFYNNGQTQGKDMSPLPLQVSYVVHPI